MGNTLSSTPTPDKLKDQIFSIVLYYVAPKANPNLKFALRDNCTENNLPIPEQADYESLLDFYSTHDMQVYRYLQNHVLNSQENTTRFYQTLINKLAPPRSKKLMNEMIEAKILQSREPSVIDVEPDRPARLTRSQLDQISEFESGQSLVESDYGLFGGGGARKSKPTSERSQKASQPPRSKPASERSKPASERSKPVSERSQKVSQPKVSQPKVNQPSNKPASERSQKVSPRSQKVSERSQKASQRSRQASHLEPEEEDISSGFNENLASPGYSEDEFTIPNESELEKYLGDRHTEDEDLDRRTEDEDLDRRTEDEDLDRRTEDEDEDRRTEDEDRRTEDEDRRTEDEDRGTEDEDRRTEEDRHTEDEDRRTEEEEEHEPEPSTRSQTSSVRSSRHGRNRVEESTLSVPSEYRNRNRFGKKCMIKD